MEQSQSVLDPDNTPQDQIAHIIEINDITTDSSYPKVEINSWAKIESTLIKTPGKKRGRPSKKQSVEDNFNVESSSVPLNAVAFEQEIVFGKDINKGKKRHANNDPQNLWTSNVVEDGDNISKNKKIRKKKTDCLKIRIKLSREFYRNLMKNKTSQHNCCEYGCKNSLNHYDFSNYGKDNSCELSLSDSLFSKAPFNKIENSNIEISTPQDPPMVNEEAKCEVNNTIFDQSIQVSNEFLETVQTKTIEVVSEALPSQEIKFVAQEHHEGSGIHEGTDKSFADDSEDSSLAPAVMNYDDLLIQPSKIHGMGLFTKIDIPAQTIILRYEGELIRKCVADKREKLYIKNGIQSIYMFAIDTDMIVDATLYGNKARYVNASCESNCITVTDTKENCIFYLSRVDIKANEELTISYNFSEKVKNEVCNCGTPKCRSAKMVK